MIGGAGTPSSRSRCSRGTWASSSCCGRSAPGTVARRARSAIAWVLRHPAITGAIVGARSAKQVEGWIGAADFRLSEAEIQEIEASLGKPRPQRAAAA